jgi:hypothetical protein
MFRGGFFLVISPAQGDAGQRRRPVGSNLDAFAAEFLALLREESDGEAGVRGAAFALAQGQITPLQSRTFAEETAAVNAAGGDGFGRDGIGQFKGPGDIGWDWIGRFGSGCGLASGGLSPL